MSDIDPIDNHALHLGGYMDAVGRVISTDSMLYALSVRRLADGQEPSESLGVPVHQRDAVENLSKEFQAIVEDVLGLNGRDRLSFYLIDYICCFEEMHHADGCFRLKCDMLYPQVEDQLIHQFELTGSWSFLTIITKSKKEVSPVLVGMKTPAPMDRRS